MLRLSKKMRANIEKIIVTLSFFAMFRVDEENFASCAEIFGNIEAFDERETKENNYFDERMTKISKNLHFGFNAEGELEIGKFRSLQKRSRVEDDAIKQPTVINNIQIIVSENASKSAVDKCKIGICNISVSSKRDNNGNIITDLHLNLVTKLVNDLRSNEIPIVDGIRGLENSNRIYNRSIYNLRNNIPQIQSRYQGGEPWYQGRRIFQRPEIRPTIDDKIDSPLSKT